MRNGSMLRAAVLFATLGTSTGCERPQPSHGVSLGDPQPAPALRLTLAGGKVFDLADEKGNTVLVFFGYTHCPDICPTTLSDWASAKRELGSAGSRVRFVFVAVDPDRDTPQSARDYAVKFDSGFVGLAANNAELEQIKANWAFATAKEEMPGMAHDAYGVMHPAQTFVIDRAGRFAMLFPPGTKAADMASDLRLMR